MKTSILLAVLLFSVGLAQADHTTDHERSKNNQQDLSRRPYTVTPANKAEKFEGDVADIEETQSEKNYKKIQLHNLGRRPYSEK